MSSFVPGAIGEGQPILKANAKSGRFMVDDKSVTRIQFIADLDNAEAGWMRFGKDMSPDFRVVPVKDLLAGKPYPLAPDVRDADGKMLYRRGFRMMVKISDKLAEGKPTVRELASNSFAMAGAIDDLLRAWYEGKRVEGKLPVVDCSAWEEVKGPHGNFKPVFTIKSIVDRPVDLKVSNGAAPKATETVTDIGDTFVDEEADDFSDLEAE
jgi:hypothetical protein